MKRKINNNKQFFKKKIAKLLPNNSEYEITNKSISNTWFNCDFYKSKNNNSDLLPIINNKLNNDVNKNLLRSRKVEILFNTSQKKRINEWLQLYRYTYNSTIKFIKLNPNVRKTLPTLRPLIKNNFNLSIQQRIIKSKIPSHTIDNAINDVVKAYKTNLTLLKQKKIRFFLMRYKKDSSKESLTLEASCFPSYALYKKQIKNSLDINYSASNTFCPSVFGNKINSVEPINKVLHDCKLSFHKGTNKYFLFIPTEKNNTININQDTAILDPGMRTFQTCYSKNNIIDYGNNVSNKIKEQLIKTDKYNVKEKYYRHIYYRTLNRIQNLTNDLHHKVSNDICNRFNCVIIGRLSTKCTNTKNTSKLNGMTKRILQNLSHFKFREILKAKCEERGVKYFEVDEKYTSKTCSYCGNYNKNLGSSKEYKCIKCNMSIDRDCNGCRNIFIRNYTNIKSDLIMNGYI